MTVFTTINAPFKLLSLLGIRGMSPYLKTTVFSMANILAFSAFNDIFCAAFASFVANLVAFKTKLLTAVEGIMTIFTTEDAVKLG